MDVSWECAINRQPPCMLTVLAQGYVLDVLVVLKRLFFNIIHTMRPSG